MLKTLRETPAAVKTAAESTTQLTGLVTMATAQVDEAARAHKRAMDLVGLAALVIAAVSVVALVRELSRP